MSAFDQATHCAYCGGPFDGAKSGKCKTRDHVVPRMFAPPTRGAVVAACQSCNSMKANMMPAAMRAQAAELRERAEAYERMAETAERMIDERGLLPFRTEVANA